MDKLILNIPYQQKVGIIIEFPLVVLGNYNGVSNIDEIWDNNIMPIIQNALLNCGLNLNTLQLEFTKENTLLWELSLIINPSVVDFNPIVNDLVMANFQKGLLIKAKRESEDFKILYLDNYYFKR